MNGQCFGSQLVWISIVDKQRPVLRLRELRGVKTEAIQLNLLDPAGQCFNQHIRRGEDRQHAHPPLTCQPSVLLHGRALERQRSQYHQHILDAGDCLDDLLPPAIAAAQLDHILPHVDVLSDQCRTSHPIHRMIGC